MGLAQLDGPQESEMGKFSLKNLSPKHIVQEIKKGVNTVVQDVKKVAKTVVHIGAAPARIAFLGLVELNMFDLAKHLATAWQSHNAEVKEFWTGLGGDPAELIKHVNHGAHTSLSGAEVGKNTHWGFVKRHERRVNGATALEEDGRDHLDIWEEMIHPHINIHSKTPLAQQFNAHLLNKMNTAGAKLGQEPISTTAAVAATPILVAVTAFLKKLLGKDGKPIIDPATANKLEAATEGAAEALGQNPASFPLNQQMVSVLPNGQYAKAGIVQAPVTGPFGEISPMILVGGLLGVGALILATSKD